MTTILIVDDDPQIVRALGVILGARGYTVIPAADGEHALRLSAEHPPALVILDLGLPGLSGIEVVRRLRAWTDVPILVVSGRTDSADKVDALDAGADDYVTKPFASDELLARVRALTRRHGGSVEEPVIRFGDATIDLAARRVTRDGESGPRVVRLTPTEWAVVEKLVRSPRRLVSQQSLLTDVWGPQYTNDTGYARLYLAQIRKKLEPDPGHPRYFITEPGIGYRFEPEGEVPRESSANGSLPAERP